MTLQFAGIVGNVATSATSVAAGAFVVSPICYGFAAIVFAAYTTVDWKKVKSGKMTKKEFKKRMKHNGVTLGGGILGASAGGAIGFAIGTAIVPGLGSLLGGIIGACAGGISG